MARKIKLLSQTSFNGIDDVYVSRNNKSIVLVKARTSKKYGYYENKTYYPNIEYNRRIVQKFYGRAGLMYRV